MRRFSVTPKEYRSIGPYLVHRRQIDSGDLVGDVLPHYGFVQAMEAFWPDIGQPAVRSVVDGNGVLILGQVTGAAWELMMTDEIDHWCSLFLPPEVYATFTHIHPATNFLNRLEET